MELKVNQLIEKAAKLAEDAERTHDPVTASLANTWATLALVKANSTMRKSVGAIADELEGQPRRGRGR